MWQIPLDGGDGAAPVDLAALEALLDDGEKARAHRGQRPGMRRRFVIAHAAARIIIGARLDRAPESVRLTRGRWGKPVIAGVEQPHFSLSHSGEIALLALAPRPVGVDVELARAGLDVQRLARRFFPDEERELVERGGQDVFTRLWTRKEACVKAAGGRLTQGMALPVAHTAHQATTRQATTRQPTAHQATTHQERPLSGPWRVADLSLPGKYAGAVAMLGDGPFNVSPKMWYPSPQENSRAVRNRRDVK